MAAVIPPSLRRGFNLPDQVPPRAGQTPDIATLRALRQHGMTHIRLPVAAENVLPEFSGPATTSAALSDLARALDKLLGIGYCVGVDLHPEGDFRALCERDFGRAQTALFLGWQGLAKRLSSWPSELVCAELLNEPPIPDDVWRPLAEKLAKAVRAELPRNILIVGAAPFQRIEALMAWRPLADRNVVYAFHYYDPMAFTHQGADWDKTSVWSRISGVPFPSQAGDPTILRLAREAALRGDREAERELRETANLTWTQASISKGQFAPLANWSAANGAPVIMNEFGVLRSKAGRSDRLAWLAAVRAAAEASGFGWAHWDYATDFGLIGADGALDRGVIHALLGA